MRIGLDLDNTVIDYGSLFYEAGREKGWIPAECGRRHEDVRGTLQQQGRDDLWVMLQGIVYGPRLTAATPYSGVAAFLRRCEREGAAVYILSHKTVHAAQGPAWDLRTAATQWLDRSGLTGYGDAGLSRGRVFFLSRREEKVDAIRHHHLDWFVDDLPAVFQEPGFPAGTRRVLFDPQRRHDLHHEWSVADSWSGVERLVFGHEQ